MEACFRHETKKMKKVIGDKGIFLSYNLEKKSQQASLSFHYTWPPIGYY